MLENNKTSLESRYGSGAISGVAALAHSLPGPRDRSSVELAMQDMDNANQELDATVSELSDRLLPILHGQRPSTEGDVVKARPSMDAKLPDNIMSQVDCLRIRTAMLRNLISRLAI